MDANVGEMDTNVIDKLGIMQISAKTTHPLINKDSSNVIKVSPCIMNVHNNVTYLNCFIKTNLGYCNECIHKTSDYSKVIPCQLHSDLIDIVEKYKMKSSLLNKEKQKK